MGTRSFIIVPNPKGDYSGIYCHWDGYPEGVGKTLVEHYANKAKIRKLINLGDISSLHPKLEPTTDHSFSSAQEGVTIAYGRDRGERDVGKKTATTLNELVEIATNMWCEFIYLHFNGVWHYLPAHEAMDRKPFRVVASAELECA
jgi:hypothetical protein